MKKIKILFALLLALCVSSLYAQEDKEEYDSENIELSNTTSGEKLFFDPIFFLPVRYSWPLRLKPGLNYPGYWAISNYIDHDPTTGVLDYNGGTQTYDGHKGTDIRIFPYAWNRVKNDAVQVIAAADGVIIEKTDGNEHDHCSWDEEGGSNKIVIRHADGTRTIYGHMKKNSLTRRIVGDSIFRGEYLGVVASSGNSDKPHLHFEVRDANNNVIDPWQKPTNPLLSSRWENQLPYLPSGLNYIAISSQTTEAISPNCPTPEKTYEKETFMQREAIHFTVMIRHEKINDAISMRVYKPDNTLWKNWQFSGANSTNRWHSKSTTLASDAPVGIWRVEVDYLGNTHTKTFNVVVYRDCNGVVNGTAYIDGCNNCVGGNTGRVTADSDEDGTIDCIDACPLDPTKTSLSQGVCNCGTPQTTCIDLCTQIPLYSSTRFYVPGNTVKLMRKKYVCIRATGGVAPSVFSESPWQYTGICDGVNSFRTVTASPNPAQDELTLTLQNIEEPVSITVYNSIGEELCFFPAAEYNENFTFPISKLPSGFLFVRISGEDFSETVRVKKN